jgi:cell division septation protein DedD
MRNVFLVLVLANLGVAAWHNWIAAEPQQRYAGPDVPSILLPGELEAAPRELAPAPQVPDEALGLAAETQAPQDQVAETAAEPAAESPAIAESEVDDEPAPAEEVAAANEPPPGEAAAPRDASVAQTCVSVGPFRELSQAATAAANLRADGLDPVQRAVEGDIWVGYWVYLAAIPTVEEAEAILAKLQESGIEDSYVIPNSDSGNLVSLGVFSEIARAGSRLSAVRAQGYEATISDRTRRATVYWVDVLLDDGQALNFESLQPQGRIMRLEQRACDETVD